MNIYQAQVVLIAGDLTGKAIVPLVAQKHGRYQASFLGQSYTLETEADVQALERAIADVGYYPYRSSQEEIAMLQVDPDLMHALFRRKMIERVDEWVELAEERIGQSGVQFYMMPGNDDDLGIDEHIASSRYVINPAGRIIELDAQHELLSFAYANPTPWQTPREWSEQEYYRRLREGAASLRALPNALFMIHVPPYESGLDTVPELDAHLRPRVTMGDVIRVAVGSTGVRCALQELQPLVSMHGHVHEAPGQSRIGRATCLNAGSEASQGILRGFVFDLGKDRLDRAFRVQG